MNPTPSNGIQWTGPYPEAFARILTPEALAFVAGLARRYHWELEVLLAKREERQLRFDQAVFEQAVQYAAEDADLALQLVGKLDMKLEDPALRRLYREVDLPPVEVLAAMERTGIRPDPAVVAGPCRTP